MMEGTQGGRGVQTGGTVDAKSLRWETGLCLRNWRKSQGIMVKMRLLLLSRLSQVRLCATPETVAHQAPPSLGFSRQEYWSGLPFPSPMHESEK